MSESHSWLEHNERSVIFRSRRFKLQDYANTPVDMTDEVNKNKQKKYVQAKYSIRSNNIANSGSCLDLSGIFYSMNYQHVWTSRLFISSLSCRQTAHALIPPHRLVLLNAHQCLFFSFFVMTGHKKKTSAQAVQACKTEDCRAIARETNINSPRQQRQP